jgi:TonB family protein
MRKVRIRKEVQYSGGRFAGRRHATALALLIPVLLLEPRLAEAESGEENVTHITDSSTERPPAVTAFPKYPSVARRDRIEGEATVCFNIDKRGRVVRPSVRSSTHRIFEKPAMAAIRRSSFEPLEAGEKPAAAKTCRTYRFRLDPVNARNGEPRGPEEANDPATSESIGQALD